MKPTKSPLFILFALLIVFLLINIFSTSAQTNTPDTNAPAILTPKFTPQNAAYTFKEWMGVIGSVLAAAYAAIHVVFMAVVHYGGMRKIIADFVGKWPEGFQFFNKPATAAPSAPAPIAAPVITAPPSAPGTEQK